MQSREVVELRVFLVRHGLRQEDLADAIDLSRVALSNIVTGKSAPRKDTIDAILAFCRKHDPSITYEQLFGAEPVQQDGIEPAPVAAGGGR